MLKCIGEPARSSCSQYSKSNSSEARRRKVGERARGVDEHSPGTYFEHAHGYVLRRTCAQCPGRIAPRRRGRVTGLPTKTEDQGVLSTGVLDRNGVRWWWAERGIQRVLHALVNPAPGPPAHRPTRTPSHPPQLYPSPRTTHTHTRARARASASALRGDAETRQPSLLMTATPAPGDEAAVVLLLASPRGHAFCLAARPFFSLRRPATLFASPPRALVCLAVRDWRLAGGVVPPKRRPVPRRLSRSLGAGRSLAANSHPGAACPARRRRTCRWCTCCPQPARSTRSE